MDQKSFNLNTESFGGYSRFFIKIIIAIIIIYAFIILINFLRDKFLNNEINSKTPQITDLLSILNKLFYLSGFGFIIANIVQMLLSEISRKKSIMNFMGDWDYLTFGIILIFMGIGFKSAKNTILKNKND